MSLACIISVSAGEVLSFCLVRLLANFLSYVASFFRRETALVLLKLLLMNTTMVINSSLFPRVEFPPAAFFHTMCHRLKVSK